MPVLRNVSPFGDLSIPLLNLVVSRGDTFEVSAEHAKLLLHQPVNFAVVDEPKPATTEKGSHK